MAIDFSDLGGQPVSQPLDFSDLGGQKVSAPQSGTWLENAGEALQKGLKFIDNPGYALRGEQPPQVNDLDATNPITDVGNAFDKASGYISEKLGQTFPNHPAIGATAGTVAALANPTIWAQPETKQFQPNMDLPEATAQSRAARTGLQPQDIQRLYKDPSAFNMPGDTAEAGAKIGLAKADSGINLGVQHNDAGTLTPENIKLARSPRVVGKDAIASITDDLSAARQLLPDGTLSDHAALADIQPDTVNKALDDSNVRLSKMIPGTAQFRAESAIKSNLQNLLQEVAPEVKAQNANYARLKLRDSFQSLQGVNKNGNVSKLGAALNTIGAGLGASVGAHFGNPFIGATVGGAIGKYGQQLYHAPYIAGLQTALGGYATNAIEPGLTAVENATASPAAAYIENYYRQR